MVSCNNQHLYFSGNAQNYGLVATYWFLV